MKHISYILLALSLLVISCRKENNDIKNDMSGTASVSINTTALLTKSSTGDGVVADGGGVAFDAGVPDLTILLFDSSHNLAALYPGEGAALSDDPTPSETLMEVTFEGLTNGETYSVYAIANTQGLWSMTDGDNTYSSWLEVMAALTRASDPIDETVFSSLRFTALSPEAAPVLQSNRLPLSAIGSLVITNGTGRTSAELLRCVGKVTVTVENNTGADLLIAGLELGEVNPDSGYLVPQTGAGIPEGVQYSTLQMLNSDVTVHTGTVEESSDYHIQQVVTSQFLFPGAAGEGKYTLDIAFGGDNSLVTYTCGETIVTASNLPDETKEYFIMFQNTNSGYQDCYSYLDEDSSTSQVRVTYVSKDFRDSEQVPQDPEYRWKFEEYSDGYKIKNSAAGKYIYTEGDQSASTPVADHSGDGHDAFYIVSASTTPDGYKWTFSETQINHSKQNDMWAAGALTRGATNSWAPWEPVCYVTVYTNTDRNVAVYEAVKNVEDRVVSLPIIKKSDSGNIMSLDRNQNLNIYVTVNKSKYIDFEVGVWEWQGGYTENVHFD